MAISINGRVKRTGLTTIRDVAFKLCNLIGKFDPLIRRIYPNNTALHTALDAVNVACSALVEEADLALPVGD